MSRLLSVTLLYAFALETAENEGFAEESYEKCTFSFFNYFNDANDFSFSYFCCLVAGWSHDARVIHQPSWTRVEYFRVEYFSCFRVQGRVDMAYYSYIITPMTPDLDLGSFNLLSPEDKHCPSLLLSPDLPVLTFLHGRNQSCTPAVFSEVWPWLR